MLFRRAQSKLREQIFSEIYAKNLWGSLESVSGPGSTLPRTAAFRDKLACLLTELNTRTLLDAPCGDFNWMKELMLELAQVAELQSYTGVDIVPDLIAENRRRHQDSVRRFLHLDLVRDRLPQADLILCRDCLVHFSFAEIRAALRNFRRSRSSYLLTTTFTHVRENADIATGSWRRLDLRLPPLNFPEPIRMVDEKRRESDGCDSFKYLGLWELKTLPV